MYKRLRELREDANLTQTQIATVLHCAQRTYSNYERGDHDLPTEVLIMLAKFFCTSTDYILGLNNERSNKHSKTPRRL